ncbi:hypothetical protein FACS1894211_13150 [Clostridia bacterium]|nr:hypothetical protein FACS1894211_13150 [Clostridia bacterium]
MTIPNFKTDESEFARECLYDNEEGILKKFITLTLALALALGLVGCGQPIKINSGTATADLSQITLVDLIIGDNINGVDLTQFSNDNHNESWTYSFDEVYIKTDASGVITKLQSPYDYSVAEVKEKYGESKDYVFDSDQRLRAFSYADKTNALAFTVVYEENGGEIVWVILEKN